MDWRRDSRIGNSQMEAAVGDFPTRPGIMVVWKGIIVKASVFEAEVLWRACWDHGCTSELIADSSVGDTRFSRIMPPSREIIARMYSRGVSAGSFVIEVLGV